MRLDIELSETEIHVIRLALEAMYQYNGPPKAVYKDGHAEVLYTLRLRFRDLASIPLPTP